MNNIDYQYDLHSHHELVLSKSKYKGNGLTGLVNLGNKCFMNSVIQCLSNTLKMTDYFLSTKYKDDDPEQLNKRRKEYYLIISYTNLLVNIWENNQILKPRSFVENLSKFVGKYFTLEQQDSHECLMYILDILHKGLSYEIDINIVGNVQNESDVLMKQSLEQWKNFYEKSYSFIIETFNGMYYNKINCNNCEFKENIFEPFNCLSLNINENTTNLNDCLHNYFDNTEMIDTWSCEKCSKKGCSKTVNAWTFPNYIIIHFKRFTNDNKKINTHIDFPIEDLNLSTYIDPLKQDPNNYIYSLYAVNYHSGTSKSGHYWSACRNLDNSWYLFNDTNVSKFHDNNILTKDAYMLFYYRKMINVN